MARAGTPLRLVERWLAALNGTDRDTCRALLAPEARFRFQAEEATLTGAEAVLGSFQGWRGVFVTLHGAIVDAVADGGRAAVALRWSGTAKTGHTVSFPACWVVRVRDGGSCRSPTPATPRAT